MSKTNKKNTGKIVLIVILSILVIIGAGVVCGLKYYSDNLKAPNPTNEQIAFTVEKGETMDDVISKLYEAGLIKNELVAKVYVKLNKINSYYAGNFILNTDNSVNDIFNALTDVTRATEEEVLVTLVDGQWAKDYAKAIASKTNLTSNEILAAWNNSEYLNKLIDKYEFLTEDILASEHVALEGYLFPETYSFFANTTVEQVTEKILDYTNSIYLKYKDQIAESEYSTHEIFTLASIIMFEASNADDMKNVSGVFYNRLRDGWKLQSSVTVCYALYEYDSWEECESNTDINSAYNTYRVEGLPIGPVCNGNEIALDAALNPYENDYYYFIADVYGDGKVIFARTYAEHEANIRKYLY